MSTQDEQFAQQLRARVDAVAPTIDVAVDRVVPRARRRRAVTRSGLTATVLVLVLGAGWGAGDAMRGATPQPAGPAGTLEPVATQAPATSATPSAQATVRPTTPTTAVVADDGTVTGVPGDPWDGDERYWYQLVENGSLTGELGGVPERAESWSSRERPGLVVWDGDLDGASAMGPTVVLGTFVVAGQRHEMLTDPRVLPTDAEELAQVLRDSLEDGRGSGSDDDKIFEVVRTSLRDGGLWDEALRSALWGAAATLPGAETGAGQDGAGRPGEVLRYTDSTGAVHQLVREDSTGLLLEDSSPQDGGYTRYLEQRPVDEVPLEPTIELAGCAMWATC